MSLSFQDMGISRLTAALIDFSDEILVSDTKLEGNLLEFVLSPI